MIDRPPATPASIAADGAASDAAYRATIDSAIDRLAARAIARGDRTLDLLLLSGGGQNGAYGAGFLRGWHERADHPMPRFDLVTGISTGAIQAPFAVLGTTAALDTLRGLYLAAAEGFAPTFDWLFWLRRTGGLVDATRFHRTIRHEFNPAMAAALREEFAGGRQLLMLTTDQDLGVGHVWDIAHELSTGSMTGNATGRTPGVATSITTGNTAGTITGSATSSSASAADSAALDRVRSIVLASSAIPAIFPPIVLDGHVHTDGGSTSNLLTLFTETDWRALADRLRARGLSLGTRDTLYVHLWIVMNTWTQARPVVINPASRGAIRVRNGELMLLLQQPQLLTAEETLVHAVNADVPGLRLTMRYTAVPSSLASEPGADALFAHAWMRRLDSLGEARALGATPWDTASLSPYLRPPT